MSKSTGGSLLRIIELARGGMGTVEIVLREEGDFSRILAVKRLLPEHVSDPEFRDMFLDEARIAGLLRHPNIVSVLDVGQDDQGPFLVMDYIAGTTVSKLIKASRHRGQQLPVQVCLRIARDIANGLHAAHELQSRDGQPLNLVHRDVTPQNVLLSHAGEVLVADFGIAKAMGRSSKTSTGVLKGKLGYMSPEQLRFREPDRRSDLFSLGVVLFEMLAGRRAYTGEGMAAARKILDDPPPDLMEERDDVEDPVVELVFDLLAKDPNLRPATALEVAGRLDDLIATMLLDEAPLTVASFMATHHGEERDAKSRALEAAIADAKARTAKLSRGKRSMRWSGAAIAALLTIGGLAWVLTLNDEPVPQPRTPTEASTTPPDEPVHEIDIQEPDIEPALPEQTIDASSPQQRLTMRTSMQRRRQSAMMESAMPSAPSAPSAPMDGRFWSWESQ